MTSYNFEEKLDKTMKYLLQSALIFSLLWFASCKEGAKGTDFEGDLGRFDSVMIAQEKGPSVEFFYENMVEHISFPSKDSLTIYADIYINEGNHINLLLCHQAGYSRGAYKQTGIILSKLGYNSMAIDQRSGEIAQNIPNLTNQEALSQGKSTEYIDAKQDIEAAIDYLYEINGNKQVVIVGSSYSASLCLLIGKINEKVKAIVAFSPGEYLEGISVKDSLIGLQKPTFITSSKLEFPQVQQLTSGIDSSYLTLFKPDVEGIHGARALWKETEGHKEYWNAFLKFLKTNY